MMNATPQPDYLNANMNAAGSLMHSVSGISSSLKHIRQLSPKNSHLNGIGTKLKFQGNRL